MSSPKKYIKIGIKIVPLVTAIIKLISNKKNDKREIKHD